ncbi:gamma-glutamyltransferase [Bacillus sp. es.036]|uniref:gamma-glutamyltransferase n=1 Tax=Bacillus sp. es.036 TaxID=1761764 RepID=UPI000BF8F283|nr:gamma-glutamyltransferase [Bacillus sp. es.036]PFG15075.1 gamma-glutamyltranspeptidase/glutathione hydrolase [Bacillus sp. es.036]
MESKKFIILLSVIFLVGMGAFFKFYGLPPENLPFSTAPNFDLEDGKPIESSEGYGVSASHPLAVKAGMEVMKNGGNAVDAAIAVSYVLGVVEPYGSGIGGGGEMLIYPKDNEPITYMYRENAPLNGNMPSGYSGVPGLIQGMESLHEDYGTVDMKQLITPAIEIAEDGFEVDEALYDRLKGAQYRMPTSDIPHFYPKGKPINPGVTLKQKELAETLRKLSNKGSDSFYEGELGENFLEATDEIKSEDLQSYSVLKQEPVKGEFAGYDVYSAPAPLAGITLIQSLQMAELMNIEETVDEPADFIHIVGEITKRSYNDRIDNIADPAFEDIQTEKLTSMEYSSELAEDISMEHLSDEYEVNDSPADEEDHDNTTHFVVIDKEGTMVSATHTLSNFFGSGKYVDGYFVNNQLKNFSESSDSPNKIEPGKSPRSFTAPTILSKDGKPVIGIGTPGGKRIPMMIAEVLIRNLTFKESIEDAIQQPRFYVEDEKIQLESEEEYPEEVVDELEDRGYEVEYYDAGQYYGGVQSLIVNYEENMLYGGADQRRLGAWQVEK